MSVGTALHDEERSELPSILNHRRHIYELLGDIPTSPTNDSEGFREQVYLALRGHHSSL